MKTSFRTRRAVSLQSFQESAPRTLPAESHAHGRPGGWSGGRSSTRSSRGRKKGAGLREGFSLVGHVFASRSEKGWRKQRSSVPRNPKDTCCLSGRHITLSPDQRVHRADCRSVLVRAGGTLTSLKRDGPVNLAIGQAQQQTAVLKVMGRQRHVGEGQVGGEMPRHLDRWRRGTRSFECPSGTFYCRLDVPRRALCLRAHTRQGTRLRPR